MYKGEQYVSVSNLYTNLDGIYMFTEEFIDNITVYRKRRGGKMEARRVYIWLTLKDVGI